MPAVFFIIEAFLVPGNCLAGLKKQQGSKCINAAKKKIRVTASADTLNKVGVTGFEPAASTTRMLRDTKLRYTPTAKL